MSTRSCSAVHQSRQTAATTLVLLTLVHAATAARPTAPEVLREHGVCVHRAAFTPSECDRIVEQFSQLDSQRDVRVQESVSRTNFFDHPSKTGAYDWILDRILTCASKEPGAEAVQWGFDVRSVNSPTDLNKRDLVDFVLMHEFKAGDFFDWHVDTKPSDATGRTINVNVMLSDGGAYEGGSLSVGAHTLDARKGDLYWYPAAYPHKVGDIQEGLRHTLVVAIKAPPKDRDQSDYWTRAEANFAHLAHTSAKTNPVSKWHFLHGEYLVDSAREAEADMAFALAYAATPQAAQYAEKFDEDGQRLVAAGRVAESLPFFRMASRIDGSNALYKSHLEAIEAALQPQLDTSQFPTKPPKSLF